MSHSTARECVQREREVEGGGKQTGRCEDVLFFSFAESDEAGSLHDHWSIRRGELTEGPGDWSRKKSKGKIYSTITATTKASTGPSGLQIPLLVSGRNPEGLSFLPPSKTCLHLSA